MRSFFLFNALAFLLNFSATACEVTISTIEFGLQINGLTDQNQNVMVLGENGNIVWECKDSTIPCDATVFVELPNGNYELNVESDSCEFIETFFIAYNPPGVECSFQKEYILPNFTSVLDEESVIVEETDFGYHVEVIGTDNINKRLILDKEGTLLNVQEVTIEPEETFIYSQVYDESNNQLTFEQKDESGNIIWSNTAVDTTLLDPIWDIEGKRVEDKIYFHGYTMVADSENSYHSRVYLYVFDEAGNLLSARFFDPGGNLGQNYLGENMTDDFNALEIIPENNMILFSYFSSEVFVRSTAYDMELNYLWDAFIGNGTNTPALTKSWFSRDKKKLFYYVQYDVLGEIKSFDLTNGFLTSIGGIFGSPNDQWENPAVQCYQTEENGGLFTFKYLSAIGMEENKYDHFLSSATAANNEQIWNHSINQEGLAVDIDFPVYTKENNQAMLAGLENLEDGTKLTLSMTNAVGQFRLGCVCDQPKTYLDPNFFCANQSFNHLGVEYKNSGVHHLHFPTDAGCDSVVVLNLIRVPSYGIEQYEEICPGEFFEFGGEQLDVAGSYQFTYRTHIFDCDSTIFLNLGFVQEEEFLSFEACEEFTYNDSTYVETGMYTQVSTNDCETLINLDVTILESTTTAMTSSACAPIEWFDQTLDVSGSYQHLLVNQNGCDSLLELDFTLTPLDNTISIVDNAIIANLTDANYQWTLCDGTLIGGATTASFTPDASGEYAVIISKDECTSTSDCSSFTISNTEQLGDHVVNFHPNPTTDFSWITFNEPINQVTVSCYDIHGRLLSDQHFQHQKNIQLDVREFTPGVYFYKLTAGEYAETFKLVKE